MNTRALINFTKNALPAPLVAAVQKVKRVLSDLDMDPPVVQMYLNQEGINTHIAFNDFYGLLVPEAQAKPKFVITFYRADGTVLYVHSGRLNALDAKRIDVRRFFKEHQLESTHGLVSLQITPDFPKKEEYKRMGRVGSFFYVLYEHDDGSLGHIHPSSILDYSTGPLHDFLSGQSIFTKGLKGIRLLQCNPSHRDATIRHEIIDFSTHQIILSKNTFIPARGMKVIDFELDREKMKSETLTVQIKPLPSGNSKPILVRQYSDGRASYSHS